MSMTSLMTYNLFTFLLQKVLRKVK